MALDQWFSDEFSSQTVANGGNIPNDHILQVTSASNGLRTVTVVYTATAADAGKTIGVRLGGKTSAKYTLGSGAPSPNDYYGMMDSVVLSATAAPVLAQFSSGTTVIGNTPTTLSWTVVNPGGMTSLTLNDGTNTTDVLSATNTTTGAGSIQVSPDRTTTYTLMLDGTSSMNLTLSGGSITSLTSTRGIALAADAYQISLGWQVSNPLSPGSLVLSDGTNQYDAAALTNPTTGQGSGTFLVPSASTTFTLNLNHSSATRSLRILREAANTGNFTLNKVKYAIGEATTATWTGATGNADSWIGIYTATDHPGTEYASQWNYLNGTRTVGGNHTTGSMSFTLPEGEYMAVMFLDGGYTLEMGPLFFRVTDEPDPVAEPFKVLSATLSGTAFTLVWESKADYVYRIFASSSLEGTTEEDWELLEGEYPSEGDGTTSYTETLPNPIPVRRFYKVFGGPAS